MHIQKITCSIAAIVLAVFLLSGCSVSTKSIKSPNYHVEFYKKDFEYSKPVSAQATSERILGIDWARFFNWNNGSIDSDLQKSRVYTPVPSVSMAGSGETVSFGVNNFIAPVVGNVIKGNTSAYALFNLMEQNPGYDVIMYPRFEMNKKGFPLIYTKTTVHVTARLAKVKR
jgi:hypothetical protein